MVIATARGELIRSLSDALSGRLVRWPEPGEVVGDYEGRDRTLEVFNADAADQRSLLRKMRPLRPRLGAAAGGPEIVIFHTRGESARLYAEFIGRALQDDALVDTAVAIAPSLEIDALALDVEVAKGSNQLPRKAA